MKLETYVVQRFAYGDTALRWLILNDRKKGEWCALFVAGWSRDVVLSRGAPSVSAASDYINAQCAASRIASAPDAESAADWGAAVACFAALAVSRGAADEEEAGNRALRDTVAIVAEAILQAPAEAVVR